MENTTLRFLFILFFSLLLVGVSNRNLFSWEKVPWKGEVESPIVINQKSYIKYTQELEGSRRPLISSYTNIQRSFNDLDLKSSDYREKLVLTKTKLTTPKKNGFARFFFKDHHSEFIKYTDKAHGLFTNSIHSVLEDQHGFIWIASDLDGLVKTNGDYSWNYKLENGLRSNTVTKLHLDSRKVIWICWDKGLSYLKNGQLINIENQKINASRITRIREDIEGNVWITSEGNGLFKIVGNEIEWFNVKRGLSSNEIQDIAFSQTDEIFVASISGGLSKIKNGRIEIIKDKEPDVYEFAPIALHLSKGKLWIGSFAGSNFYYEKGKIYKVKFQKRFERCFDIAENEYGIWFADYASGMSLLKTDGTVHSYNASNGLTDRNALSFTIDHNKNVWVADPFSGLSFIKISPFRENKEMGSGVTSIIQEKNGIKWLVQNGNGLSKVQKMTLDNVNCKVGKGIFTNDHPWDLLPNEDGSYWVGTNLLGIGQFDRTSYNFYRFAKGNIIMDITKGENGDAWFSTVTDGLRKWDNKAGKFILYTTKDGLSSNNVLSTTLDGEGKLWICTNKGVNVLFNGKIAVLDKRKGLSSDQINRVVQDKKGRLWIATGDAGINLLSNGRLITLSRKEGLIDNRIVSVFESANHDYWVITSSGLSRLMEISKDKFRIENFGVAYGNFMLDFTGAVLEQPDGKILFGTNKRTIEFDPYFYKKEEGLTKFHLDKITVDKKSVQLGINAVEVYNDQKVEIDISVLNWGEDLKGKSFYCLLRKGDTDTIWVPTKVSEPITPVLEGKGIFQFLFKVNLSDSSEIYQGPAFHVKVVWYQSLWFILFVILLIFILINRFVKYRLKVLNKRKMELEEIVETRTKELEDEKKELSKANFEILMAMEEKDVVIYEMHHRVKNNLQTISTLLDMQMRSLKNEDSISVLKEAVRRISAMSTSHELLYSSDELSDINFKHFLTHLISSQSQLFTDQYSPSIVEYDIDEISVNVSDCITIGMIVSEIISNSAKHAFQGVENPRIKIKAKLIDDNCVFSVSDNGNGSDLNFNENESKGLGIRLIKIFTSKLKGKIEFKNCDPGLEIEITFPLNVNNKKSSQK